MIAHPISGSFHWSLHVVKIGMNGKWFMGTVPNALTDTGTTYIYLPEGKIKTITF